MIQPQIFSLPVRLHHCLILLCLFWSLTAKAQSSRYYVDPLGLGSPDGQSWATAFHDLHDALALAMPGDEVWVAKGTYAPSTTGDRHARYQLPNGVKLYGGFMGTEIFLSERPLDQHLTVLSGDVAIPGDSLDNSYTLLYLFSPDTATVVDGFTLRDAVANDPAAVSGAPGQSGAALYIEGSDGIAYPTIRNCIFEHNTAKGSGGAVYINGDNGSVAPLFENCQFINNYSLQNGGGVCRNGGSWWDRQADFVGCTFEYNRARLGACMYLTDAERSDTLDFRQCNFYRNAASFSADVLGLDNLRQTSWSVIKFSQCTIEENKSAGLIETSAFLYAGNVHLYLDSVLMHDNRINDLSSPTASAILLVAFGKAKCTITNSTLSGQTQPDFTSIHLTAYQIAIEGIDNASDVDNLMLSNSNVFQCDALLSSLNVNVQQTQVKNAGFSIAAPSGRVNASNSTFYKTYLGLRQSYSKTIQNCVFVNNYHNIVIDSVVNINNTIIIDLKSNNGILVRDWLPFFVREENLHIRNCIFSDAFKSCPPNINCFTPDPGLPIGLDPLMVDTSQGDFRLLPCSPAWNAGDNASATNMNLLTDLVGAPRIMDGIIDIGAYEIPAMNLSMAPDITGACFGQSTGTVQLALTNSCPPYNYAWTKGTQAGNSLTGLAAGVYQYTITDARGRTLVSTAAVPSSAPQLTVSGDTVICPASSMGTLVALVGGDIVPPVIYNWSNSASTDSLEGLSVGQYTVTATDAIGCSVTRSATILSSPPLSLIAQVTPATALTNANGSIQVVIQNGQEPYSAYWAPTGDTTFSIGGLLPGPYMLSVTDGGGCVYNYTYEVEAVNATSALDVSEAGSVLPNPARDQVTVSFSNSNGWQLFNTAGKEVLRVEAQIQGGTLDVELGNLSPGVYFYTFYAKNTRSVKWHRLVIVE